MWKWLCVFSSVTLQIICGKLVGDHICRTEESYTVNVTEQYVRNATVRNYKWCLNVPPRCSYYTIKKINDTRIAEKNKTRLLENCCPGFVEREHHCVSKCDNCQNGICKEETCHCASGFNGINCDTRCNLGFWGPNCTNICDCGSDSCNHIDGNCTPNSYKNVNSEENDTTLSADVQQYGPQTTEITTISDIGNIEEWNDNNANSVSKKGNTLYFIPTSSSKDTDNFATYITTTTSNTLPIDDAENKIKDITLNKYQTHVENILDTLKKIESTTRENLNVRLNLVNNRDILIPVGIQYDHLAKPLMQETTTPTVTLQEDYLGGNDKSGASKIPSNEYYFINTISVSAITTVALILLALIIVTIKRKYEHKEKLDSKKKNVSTVAVYTTSIFHTPLPDPPVCENPSYLSPMECRKCLNEPTVKTCLIYNMDRSNQMKPDCRNYEYDYPPSTGSYRAASVIEPLDADVSQIPLFVQTEPVYDEIPCRGDVELMAEETPCESQSVSLYMNTCDSSK